MLPPRILLVEFNELSPTLLERFINSGDLPNFKRLRDGSVCYTTDASSEQNLEPWTQWPTLHSGIPDSEHGIEHLGQAGRLAGRGIGHELAAAGHRVGIFGSMNVDYGQLVEGFYVPDPWAMGRTCQPSELNTYYEFVASAVQENSNNGLRRDLLPGFGTFLMRNGLRPRTVVRVLRQLVSERRSPALTWRRGMTLDELNYDVFRSLTRKHKVDFATFFSNSTAHFQHYYWRNLEPELFTDPPPASDDKSLSAAVLSGYQSMDRLLGQMLSDFQDWRLIFATGLSQQPWDTDKALWRPNDAGEIVSMAGVDRSKVTIEPVMAEEFVVDCADEAQTDSVQHALSQLTCGDAQLLRFQRHGTRLKVASDINTWKVDPMLTVSGTGGERKFVDLFQRIHTVRSGRHHPDGAFWIQSSRPVRDAGTIPLTAVAPTILSLYGLTPPDYMATSAVEFAGN